MRGVGGDWRWEVRALAEGGRCLDEEGLRVSILEWESGCSGRARAWLLDVGKGGTGGTDAWHG